MADKARKSGALFRPHFKTHQSVAVAELFRKEGVTKITVSSVRMAHFFASNGWNDITIAFPVNLRETEALNRLANSIRLQVLIDSTFVANMLEQKTTAPLGVFIKIDTGYHRSGLLPEQNREIQEILQILKASNHLQVSGFLTHAGHTYHAKSKAEILHIMHDAQQKFHILKQTFLPDFPTLITSYGDTPSCSLAENCFGFDEIRPGNFVFYDVMQFHLGSCTLKDIAVAVACPVVGVFSKRNEVVIYGGAVHLSKEYLAADNGSTLFGYVVLLNDNFTWDEPIAGAWVSNLSQEHGIVSVPNQLAAKLHPGDLLGILPVHSCLSANLLEKVLV